MVIVLAVTGCSYGATPEPRPLPPVTSATTDVVRSGVVSFDGVDVAYRCAGEGGPVVILEVVSDLQPG